MEWILKKLGVYLVAISIIISSCSTSVFETNSISDYGRIEGNYDNDRPREIIFSFFPERIEDYFSDVVYHYKAEKGDTYGCEAYLEFTISDKEQFVQYLNQLNIPEENTKPVNTDSSFTDYTLEHHFSLRRIDEPQCWSISYSRMCKILYSEEEQKIIFWALLVEDGGGTITDDLHFFFTRFNISPDTYATDLY